MGCDGAQNRGCDLFRKTNGCMTRCRERKDGGEYGMNMGVGNA